MCQVRRRRTRARKLTRACMSHNPGCPPHDASQGLALSLTVVQQTGELRPPNVALRQGLRGAGPEPWQAPRALAAGYPQASSEPIQILRVNRTFTPLRSPSGRSSPRPGALVAQFSSSQLSLPNFSIEREARTRFLASPLLTQKVAPHALHCAPGSPSPLPGGLPCPHVGTWPSSSDTGHLSGHL